MKIMRAIYGVAVCLLLTPARFAQDAVVKVETTEAEVAKAREKKLQEEERAKAVLEKKTITYSGFIVDAARTEKKSKLFSLREPRKPKTDYKNISTDERTGRPQGFVLFRLEF